MKKNVLKFQPEEKGKEILSNQHLNHILVAKICTIKKFKFKFKELKSINLSNDKHKNCC